MKTTKTSALSKRISKLLASKDVSKNSLVYRWLCEILDGETTIRPVFSQGSSWKYSSLVDKTAEVSRVLKLLKLDFEVSNDAQRGGKTGARIDILTKVK